MNMLKIKPYKDNSFYFYEEVVKSKRNTSTKPKLKEELKEISTDQDSYFKVYDKAFSSNSLSTVQKALYCDNDRGNLSTLYNYRNKKIQELKNYLTRHPLYPQNILNVCQNCTINEVDTLDHVLGQNEFPEFAVHPNNLFPCCSVCNKKKSDKFVDENGSQLFLNLFLDDLPHSQYLYVSFGANWLPSFYLKQPEGVPDTVFNRIESHYERLDLLKRFSDGSNNIISSLRSTIRAFSIADVEVEKRVEDYCREQEPIIGYNHREIVLYRALSSSESFINECSEGLG